MPAYFASLLNFTQCLRAIDMTNPGAIRPQATAALQSPPTRDAPPPGTYTPTEIPPSESLLPQKAPCPFPEGLLQLGTSPPGSPLQAPPTCSSLGATATWWSCVFLLFVCLFFLISPKSWNSTQQEGVGEGNNSPVGNPDAIRKKNRERTAENLAHPLQSVRST